LQQARHTHTNRNIFKQTNKLLQCFARPAMYNAIMLSLSRIIFGLRGVVDSGAGRQTEEMAI
jgi:hypothetical protein